MRILTTSYMSPAGLLTIGTFGEKLCLCDWDSRKDRESYLRNICRHLGLEMRAARSDVATEAISLLDDYFAGKLKKLAIPMAMAGTPFQCKVWEELRHIPYGDTISYAALARRMGCKAATRAVANAIAANPLSIFVPCHRVIRSDGKPSGYAGGSDAKSYLLTLESIHTHGIFSPITC